MALWQVRSFPRDNTFQHRFADGRGHALFSPLVAHVFKVLRVGASVFGGNLWWAIHSEPSMIEFEVEHGVVAERYTHNDRVLSKVLKSKKPLLARFGGTSDFFVPIVVRGEVAGVLVAGPFETARPTSSDILSRWRALTGRQGHPADPEFAAYLSRTLSTLVLDESKPQRFERLLVCLAKLMSGEGRADELANQADALRCELEPARHVERAWNAVATMLDDRSPRTWSTAQHAYDLGALGLARPADHLLVGLTASLTPTTDPVDEAVRRDAFQRACVELARSHGSAVAGRVGDHGVAFLLAARNPSSRGSAAHKAVQRNQKLQELSERAAQLARKRFGLALHCGGAAALGSKPLSRSYQSALAAAESALARDARLEIAEPGARSPVQSLRRLRQELGAKLEERPDLAAARFDRYLEAVALDCGYRLDAARGHLEAGFDRIAEPLARVGTLDDKSFTALCDVLDRAARQARTLDELFGAYRRAVADVTASVTAPTAARQDRSLRQALDYIHQHYTETLALAKVARLSGFAPYYFSKLFHERERMTFAEYVRKLRIERAKQLLADTDLAVSHIVGVTGFHSAQYFCRVFRAATKKTPLQYRTGLEKVRKQTERIRTITKTK